MQKSVDFGIVIMRHENKIEVFANCNGGTRSIVSDDELAEIMRRIILNGSTYSIEVPTWS